MTYKRSRGLAAMATVVMVAVCVAACGSSSSSSSSSSSAAAASSATGSRAKLAACLKQHGVTLAPRPAGGGGYGPPPGAGNGNGNGSGSGGGGFRGGGRGRFNNPKFRAAFQACGAAAGFRGRRGNFRPSSAAIAKFASCVKQHGYTLPKANLSGRGPVYPVKIERDAKFQSASRACQSLLRPPGGGGAPPAA